MEIYKNKRSGKCFIFVAPTKEGWAEFIDRDGRRKELKLDLFERYEETNSIVDDKTLISSLLERGLLTSDQVDMWEHIEGNNESYV